MCVIIDANVASQVCARDPADAFVPLVEAIWRRRTVLVYGGRLVKEYGRVHQVASFVARLDRAGLARRIPDNIVDAVEKKLIENASLKSDDPHIIALAQAAGARVLCTEDAALRDDFRDPTLVRRPRGKIYTRPQHVLLLRDACAHCE